jgi:hypothetical protein
LSVGLLTYHNLNSTFPPSSNWPGLAGANYQSVTQSGYGSYGVNWVVVILPQIDQIALYQTFRPNAASAIAQTILSPSIPAVAMANPTSPTGGVFTPLPVMTCPTDTYSRTPFDGTGVGMNASWARGNYAANGGLNTVGSSGSGNVGWSGTFFRGVMGLDCAMTLDQIRDGASNTLLLAEIRAGLIKSDPRGVWALGGTPSALWDHGWSDTDNGPNNLGAGDQTFNCSQISNNLNAAALGMPCNGSMNQAQTARSMHVGGIQAAFCDGSVHFLSNYIQLGSAATSGTGSTINPSGSNNTGTSGNPTLGVWDMLNLSNDGQAIPSGAY